MRVIEYAAAIAIVLIGAGVAGLLLRLALSEEITIERKERIGPE